MNDYNNSINVKKARNGAIKKRISESFIIRKLAGLFLNFQRSDEKFRNSAIFVFFAFLRSKFNYIKRIKKAISKGFERSYLINALNSGIRHMGNVSLRNLGVMAFFFGIFIVIFNAFRYIGNVGSSGYNYPVAPGVGIITVIVSVVMSMSAKNLGELIAESRILSFFCFDILNFDRKKFVGCTGAPISNIVFAFCGVSLGAVSAFIDPLSIILAVFLLFIIAAVIENPESGIILTCFLMPFLGENMLVFFVSICCIAVLLKVIRNKRVLKFGVLDFSYFVFALCVLVSGLNGISGFGSLGAALKILLFILFGWLLSNTIKTTLLTEKCLKALIISVSVVSAVGIIIFIFDIFNLAEMNVAFDYINGVLRTIPFASDYSYAELAVVVVPFTLAMMRKSKIAGSICFILCVVFAVLSMDISIWISCALALIIYFSVISPVVFLYFCFICLLFAVINFLLPGVFSLVHGFIHNFSNHEQLIATVSTANDFGISAVREFSFLGLGVGKESIKHVFSCLFGNDSAELFSGCSLSVKILVQYGVAGIVSSLGIVLCNMSNCFSLLHTDRFCKKELSSFIVAVIASVLTSTITGMFFPYLSSPNLTLCIITVMYISMSVRKSSEIEFVPEAYEIIGEEEYQ